MDTRPAHAIRAGTRPRGQAASGFALVTVLVWLSLLSTAALGVALATSAEAPASGALHERLRLARAAESAASLVVGALAGVPDWRDVPAGPWTSPFVDGAPGPRSLGGRLVDLTAESAQRTCGRIAPPCDPGATGVATPLRPWGARNPRWRLVLHLPMAAIDATAGRICPCYVVAWVADDPGDADGDPDRDAPLGVAGHGQLLVRAAAFGEAGGLAEVEALVASPCRRAAGPCLGIRVQSWGAVHDAVP